MKPADYTGPAVFVRGRTPVVNGRGFTPDGNSLPQWFFDLCNLDSADDATLAAAKQIPEAKEIAQDIAEIPKGFRVEALSSARCSRHALVAETIIRRPLLRIGQHAVGFGRFLELLFGRLIARIAVRMMLHRQLPIGRL